MRSNFRKIMEVVKREKHAPLKSAADLTP
ncbi:hypothetical protein PanWU01x14_021000 [Parasponia andersonii]|uniref:Uncharacterized protein n=1 Tax=Parasponia andersonii TaxID=3476 RepID=A0A2P5DXU6_PARAD|nr:hypothetical protein PanWU01x14_021000 [Parasponia andersonii]